MKQVCVFLADGFEEVEALTTVDLLRRARVYVDTVSITDEYKVHVCKVDNGSEILQIVCGAPNVEEGQLVVIAEIGAVMPSGLIIKPSKLRGIDSNGMLCSPRELALPNAPLKKGILVLDPKNYNIGEKFFK